MRQLRDAEDADRLEERQLQAKPSAEANFTNWNNNNNGIGVTSLVAAGLGFSGLYVVLISLTVGWWDACMGTCVGGRINTAEQIWSPHLASAQANGLIFCSEESRSRPPSHIQKGATVFHGNVSQEHLWHFC